MSVFLLDDSDINRFLVKTAVVGSCIEWTASCFRNGYGQFGTVRIKTGKRTMALAHRVGYQIYYESLPDLPLDHVCKNVKCVNPLHLEPVSTWENTKRSSNPIGNQEFRQFCPQGHEYSEENIYRAPGAPNKRKCKTCMAKSTALWNEKVRMHRISMQSSVQ